MTVSEVSRGVRRSLENAFGAVRVRGELGRVSRAASGHVYADLKDDTSVLSLIVWKNVVRSLSFVPEEGMEVVAEGRISTYASRSVYQLIAEGVRPSGIGALMQILDERRRRLSGLGLFDSGCKKPLVIFPRRIGVVTSPTGAVIEDILHRVGERFPTPVVVWPSLVQGSEAAGQIAAGIAGLNALERPVDVIIVARGGGSVEDLWAFNEEIVVRAVYDSVCPVISAVGHQTDTTLVDHAADVRAPTPTAAAEFALPVTLGSVRERLTETDDRLRRAMYRGVEVCSVRLTSARLPTDVVGRRRDRYEAVLVALGVQMRLYWHGHVQEVMRVGSRLGPHFLRRGVSDRGSRLSRAWERLGKAIDRSVSDRSGMISSLGRVLDSVSHIGILRRGYAVVSDVSGRILRSAGEMGPDMPIRIGLSDGRVRAVVTSCEEESSDTDTEADGDVI